MGSLINKAKDMKLGLDSGKRVRVHLYWDPRSNRVRRLIFFDYGIPTEQRQVRTQHTRRIELQCPQEEFIRAITEERYQQAVARVILDDFSQLMQVCEVSRIGPNTTHRLTFETVESFLEVEALSSWYSMK
jgi:hypothetical protein